MLARLSPRTRDLVAMALTLEASSMAIESSIGAPANTFEELDTARAVAITDQQERLRQGSGNMVGQKNAQGGEGEGKHLHPVSS